MKRMVLVFLAVFVLSVSGQQQSGNIQVLISGGTLIDGTGAARRVADVRIVGDTIKEIGKLKAQPGEQVIDAKGLIIA
ncbi:MAG: hypothetical protein JNK38_21980, partial [Acidobacteria bacterium]|nr:hypothetical protein [Acidobacteriota bacterium]